MLLSSDYTIMIYLFAHTFTKKKLFTSKVSSVAHQKFISRVIFLQKQFLVSAEELLNVLELVSVEYVPYARFARHGRKVNILECCWI